MAGQKVLMHDSFESLRPGEIKEAVDGPFREMHAQPASPDDNLGGWSRRIGNWSLRGPIWKLVELPEGRFIEGCATATVYDNASLAKGDYDWQDIAVEATITLLPLGQGWGGPAGLMFRFEDSQRYYAAVVDEDGLAKILLRVDQSWDMLAAKPADVRVGEPFTIRAEAQGSSLKAMIAGVELAVDNGVLSHGCVGFLAARPARFGPIKVAALPGEAERLERQKRQRDQCLTGKRKAHGKPVLWRKYDTKGFGSGRRIRLGDLDGDGQVDFLLLQIGGQKDKGIRCMTALSSRGEILWRKGDPRPAPKIEASGDGPCQINDIDGDGRNEVVCVWGASEFVVLDGATGATKYTAPLPPMQPLPDLLKQNILHWGAGYNDEGPTVVPATIAFADLAGRGARRDVLLADPYHTLVAMDPQFRELWRTVNSHGHFPQPYDFDGDGRDDVIVGYRRVGPDGRTLGRVNLQDHQDAIYVGPLDGEGRGPVKILMAGGEDGLLTLTPEFDIRQRVMGHVQRLSVGRFREDLPGLCIATVLFHGNPGIISLFDSTAKKVWTKDFPVLGATLQPVNWDGTGVELMLLSGIRPAQGYQGGLMDGEGELVVPLPDDGGPGLCAFAHDFDGDGLDELMLWDHDRIWIYRNDRDPPAGPRYRPTRPPLYNMSNFQCYWSRPKWQ
jgi:rhamnogalacturonan endolyase